MKLLAIALTLAACVDPPVHGARHLDVYTAEVAPDGGTVDAPNPCVEHPTSGLCVVPDAADPNEGCRALNDAGECLP